METFAIEALDLNLFRLRKEWGIVSVVQKQLKSTRSLHMQPKQQHYM